MGIEGISPFRLLVILAIVLVLFGGKRLRGLGGDLGGAIRGFRDAMKDGEHEPPSAARQLADAPGNVGEPAGGANRERPAA